MYIIITGLIVGFSVYVLVKKLIISYKGEGCPGCGSCGKNCENRE